MSQILHTQLGDLCTMFLKPPLFRKRRRETEAPGGPPGNRAGPLTTAADTDSLVDQLTADEVSIEYYAGRLWKSP